MSSLNIKIYLNKLFFLILEHKLFSLIALIALLFIISAFTYNGKKITLKRKNVVKHSLISKRITNIIEKISLLNNYRNKLANNLALITHKNSKTNKIYANNIITVMILAYISVQILSVIIIKYILLKVLTPIILMTLCIYILVHVFNKRKNKAKRDFDEVLSGFTTQYGIALNVLKALQLSMYTIPRSHKYEFSRLITSMQSSEDYMTSLDEYASRIDYDIAYAFIEILKTNYIKNDNILLALIDLQNQLSSNKKTGLQRTNKLKDKKSNIYFALACIPSAIAVGSYLLGDFAKKFYFNSFIGQVLLLVAVIFFVFTLAFMYIAEKSLQ